MKTDTPLLEGLRVASPCTASWEAMKGDARVRRCGDCRLNVYNLSAMSRREGEDLLRRSEGRLCVRFFRRADGTILTEDCPVGLRAVRRRLAMLGSALAAMFVALVAAGCGRTSIGGSGPAPTTGRPSLTVPPDRGTTGLAAPPQPVMGDVCDPPPTQGEATVPVPVRR